MDYIYIYLFPNEKYLGGFSTVLCRHFLKDLMEVASLVWLLRLFQFLTVSGIKDLLNISSLHFGNE